MDTKVTDPVCGMRIDPSEAAAETNHQGQTYYFCSNECKMKFDKEPQKYVDTIVPEQHRH